MGAAYGTSKAGVGIMMSGIGSPELIWKNLIPVIMAGVNGIYGLITAIVIVNHIPSPIKAGIHQYSLYSGFAHLAAGLCCGLGALASAMAIGIAGDAGVRSCGAYNYELNHHGHRNVPGGAYTAAHKFAATAGGSAKSSSSNTKQSNHTKKGGDQLFVAMVLIQVFAGNLALYGLITSIIITQSSYTCKY
jgi:V-type H+-transporting ATPase 16kDa proteolipid subunit